MVRNRIIYGVLWILSLVLISFYGGFVSYGIFYLLTLIPLVSLVYLIYIYLFFHMYQKIDSKWLAADDTSPFYFSLVNDYHIIFAGIRVKFYDDFSKISGLDPKTEYEFFPKSGVSLETSITCRCRGEYEVGIETVIIEDYFRLISLSYKNREPLKVMVRPKIVKLDSLGNNEISFSTKDSDVCREEPDVLTEAYLPGDSIRRVHWGVSARTGNLMVRKMTGFEENGASVILINHRRGSRKTDYLPTENKMLESMLALTLYLIGKNIPVTHYHLAAEPVVKNINRMEMFDEYYDLISEVSFDSSLDVAYGLKKIAGDRSLFDSKKIFLVMNEYDPAMNEFFLPVNNHNIETVICFVGNEIPIEISSMNFSKVKTVLINPEADLSEVFV